ncbi:MAG TPA: YihY family inner membrane protein, partial [Gammaproteobacteria bacterium]|nr:YihY family inner membrane protein [Gammaproteobacteria bacterium]
MTNSLIKSGRAAFIWLYHFVPFLLQQFVERRGLQSAASLAYTTLLSIVPLIGVTFSFFINLPVFKEINEKIQGFVFENFVPAFGNTVQEYLISFSMKASQLTLTGIVVLIIIALMLISTIDTALNQT